MFYIGVTDNEGNYQLIISNPCPAQHLHINKAASQQG
jgi:hypothetical protein